MSTNSIKLGIIAGTGASNFAAFQGWGFKSLTTEYGEAIISEGKISGIDAVLLPRHGPEHHVPPHKVNYRANIIALKELGCTLAVGISAVGSLNPAMAPGSVAVLTDFIDFTKSRILTFFDGGMNGVVHTDFTNPYCPTVSDALRQSAIKQGITPPNTCVYICVEGPRYESPAEIRMFRQWGADVVGMTNVPEVTLAREAGICYGTIAVITNFAAGVSPTPLSHAEVVAAMRALDTKVSDILVDTASTLNSQPPCLSCKAAGEL